MSLCQAAAYPGSMSCDFACMGGYTPGSSFGHMGIANVGTPAGPGFWSLCCVFPTMWSEGFRLSCVSGLQHALSLSRAAVRWIVHCAYPCAGATSGDTCKIATDVPTGGYTAGGSHRVSTQATLRTPPTSDIVRRISIFPSSSAN